MRIGLQNTWIVLAALLTMSAACAVPSPTGPSPSGTSTLTGAASQGIAVTALAGRFPTAPPPFVFPDGCCYYNDMVVRTVVPPARTPKPGRDNFYGFPEGTAAMGQKGVVGVIPGVPGYHGGHWKFYLVTWNVTPYLLTSEEAVLMAKTAEDVTVMRVPDNDFRCPIQP